MFLFVASTGSRGHLTSALKHDLTKDCVTVFFLLVIHINPGQCPPFFKASCCNVLIWIHGVRRKTFIVMNHKWAFKLHKAADHTGIWILTDQCCICVFRTEFFTVAWKERQQQQETNARVVQDSWVMDRRPIPKPALLSPTWCGLQAICLNEFGWRIWIVFVLLFAYFRSVFFFSCLFSTWQRKSQKPTEGQF